MDDLRFKTFSIIVFHSDQGETLCAVEPRLRLKGFPLLGVERGTIEISRSALNTASNRGIGRDHKRIFRTKCVELEKKGSGFLHRKKSKI